MASSAVLVESNSTSPCNDGLGKCQLLEEDMEFPMNPYIRRRLYELGPANKALKPGEAALSPCGRPNDPTRYCPQENCARQGGWGARDIDKAPCPL
ncbi:hypothetical protein SO802_010368 [Lithocarpus litseifolius]|uniref:Uncharacterized protein n=1 Tax=Lithocarpus litseifolius TaxID=425828 RepID=A0AAW2DIG6_9ROSI